MAVPTTVIISVLYLASGVFIFLLGLTILRIGRSSTPTRATALMLFFAGVGPLLSATGIILESTLREGSIVSRNMMESFEYLWEFYFPSLMLFAMSFPHERSIAQRVPAIGVVVFFPYVFHLVMMMFGDHMLDFTINIVSLFPADKSIALGSREISVGGMDNVVGALARVLERIHRDLFAVVNIIYSLGAVYLLSRNRALLLNPRLAVQLRTIFIGLTVSIAAYIAAKTLEMGGALPAGDTQMALINFSLVMSGGTIAFAVIRQQFLGIRYVMRRSVLYSAVAIVFAAMYLIVVRPISDYFGQYSALSKDAFETGFIILTIIAFQPTLIRTEEVLERVLLKGRADDSKKFRRLADAVANVTTLEELESVLAGGLRDVLDTSRVELRQVGDDSKQSPFVTILEEAAEPVTRRDLLRLEEERRSEPRRERRSFLRRKRRTMVEQILREWEPADDFEVYVPLFKGKQCVAYLGLSEKIYGVDYTPDELAQLSGLGTQVGSSLHNIELIEENLERKLFEEELKIARKIQRQLLPGEPPPLEGYELSARTVPSRYVGGDYYDYVLVDGRWLVVVVADVSGKGIPASILTATLQAAVRSNADSQTRPGLMMAKLNRLLFENTSAAEFATLFYGVVDLETGTLTYANAGHDFPYVVNGEGSEPLSQSGIVLGCLEEFPYEEHERTIPDGGVLVVYTDGVTDSESRDGEAYGTARLEDILARNATASADHICRCLIEEVRDFGMADRQDDLTVVVLKRSVA